MPKARPNPVALEAAVNVTGARPSGAGGSRDLFTEETKTVLVFKDGAVIGLTAAVSVGQLLFLTNKKSNQEVVCQVLHKRSYKPTMCYVELQFTEEKADFWGVSFSNASEGGEDLKATEQVEAEETTEDDPGTPVAPHRAEDVDQLKKEVEALREQLLALEKKNAAEAAAKAAASKTPATTESKAPEEPDLRVTNVKLELAPVNDQSPEPVKAAEALAAPLMPAAKESGETPRAVIGMALPNRKPAPKWAEEKPKDAAEEQLPKPELDFSKVPQSAVHLDDDDPNSIYKTIDPRREKVRIVGMSAFLVVLLVGGAWYGKWWQYLPVRKNAVEAVAGNVVKGNVSRAPGPAGKGAAAGGGGKEEVRKRETQAAAPSAGTVEVRKKETQDPPLQSKGEAPVVVASADTGETAGKKAVAVREKATGKTGSKKPAAAAETSAPEPVVNDAPVLPAKLLKAASPVYPPEAMLNYITGDVKAEVVVEATGHVGEVKVISGPKALREAAVEALKQYEYAPATQGGKSVASKTTAVVKFWFDP
jgi:protein TonB